MNAITYYSRISKKEKAPATISNWGCNPKKVRIFNWFTPTSRQAQLFLPFGQQVLLSHSHLFHLKVDAFKYQYPRSQGADWLLCDILEKPEIVLELLDKWLNHQWCRRFVVNLKIGRNDPVLLLKRIKDPRNGIASFCTRFIVKQLYHDREEITLMGEVK